MNGTAITVGDARDMGQWAFSSPCARQWNVYVIAAPVITPEPQKVNECLLALTDDGYIDGRMLKYPGVIFLYLRTAGNSAQFRKLCFDPPDNIEAAFAVPRVE